MHGRGYLDSRHVTKALSAKITLHAQHAHIAEVHRLTGRMSLLRSHLTLVARPVAGSFPTANIF
jgi:hypothetical protein